MSDTIGYRSKLIIHVQVTLSHYLQCKSLHSLPNFASKIQRIQVGNGQFISVLYIIPILIDIHGCRFRIFTLGSEIHENVDLVFGIKSIFELEGIIYLSSPRNK